MKIKLILAVVISVSSFSSPAATRANCEDMANFANTIMFARQSGVPESKIRDNAMQNGNSVFRRFTLMLVDAAYLVPVYKSDAAKVNAAEDFASEMRTACMAQ
ncbi:hypothetical protein KNU96_gp43 [Xanthomonas phage FoX5]|uniref:Uncharacterized protein n=1 Tax=Xanthomonas phage FoX5 TaxID=2723901 RepID=A0A858NXW6_9CAUD|nr:hypothetical protein KNU96_gp43 [Xanthomonas phage FoX5]QJB22047.1 hypothetical protein XccvBFoX5_gp69 [Xanthomonas phage FoX5]